MLLKSLVCSSLCQIILIFGNSDNQFDGEIVWYVYSVYEVR